MSRQVLNVQINRISLKFNNFVSLVLFYRWQKMRFLEFTGITQGHALSKWYK